MVQEEVVGVGFLVELEVEEDLEEDLRLEALAQEDEVDFEVGEGNLFLTVKDWPSKKKRMSLIQSVRKVTK